MERLTKYSNDLIRNKAVNILRKLDSVNGLDGDELAIISSFCLIERVENKEIKKYEDLEEQGRLLVMAYEVKKCRIAKCPERECTCQKAREYSVQEVWIRPELLGDGFYRTEEEAEQALAEMEKGQS